MPEVDSSDKLAGWTAAYDWWRVTKAAGGHFTAQHVFMDMEGKAG